MNSSEPKEAFAQTEQFNAKKSKLGFDQPRSTWRKLWETFIVLLMAGIMWILGLANQGWTRHYDWMSALVCSVVIETVWAFVLLALIFIWWKPAFLRNRYLEAESKMQRISLVMQTAFGVFVLCLAVHSIVKMCSA